MVETYVGTVELVEALAHGYGFTAIYVWQPNPHVSTKPPTPYEEGILAMLEADPFQRELSDVHSRVASSLGERLRPLVPGRFLDLTTIFEDHAGPVWVDVIGHTTEAAAAMIGRAIASEVASRLARPSRASPTSGG